MGVSIAMGVPQCWMLWMTSHRSKWMMTGGTPMTQEMARHDISDIINFSITWRITITNISTLKLLHKVIHEIYKSKACGFSGKFIEPKSPSPKSWEKSPQFPFCICAIWSETPLLEELKWPASSPLYAIGKTTAGAWVVLPRDGGKRDEHGWTMATYLRWCT